MITKYTLWSFVLGAVVLQAVTGCGKGESQTNRAGSSSEKTEFEVTKDAYASVFDDRSGTQDVDEIVEKLLKSARKQEWFDKNDPIVSIVREYPNDGVSPFLLRARIARAEPDSSSSLDDVLRRIRDELPDSMAGAFALQEELKRSRLRSSEQFLDHCSSFLTDTTPARLRKVALYSRMRFYSDTRNPTAAAMDGLRFWGEFPDAVRRMAIAPSIRGDLRQADLILESWMLDTSAAPERVALLLRSLYDLPLDSTPIDSTWNALRENYLAADISPAELYESLSHAEPVPWRRIFYLATVAARAAEAYDISHAVSLYGEFSERIGRLEARDDLTDDNIFLLRTADSASVRLLRRLYSNRNMARIFSDGRKDVYKDFGNLVGRLYRARSSFELSLMDSSSAMSRVEYKTFVDQHSDALLAFRNLSEYTHAHESVMKAFPQSEEAADSAFRVAKMYETQLRSREAAIDMYTKISEEFASSHHAASALLELARLELENERYIEAYDHVQKIELDQLPDTYKAAAKLISGICLISMGSLATGSGELQQIANEYHDTPQAAQALFLLGSNAVSQGEFAVARDYIAELTARYPASEYTVQGTRILAGLPD